MDKYTEIYTDVQYNRKYTVKNFDLEQGKTDELCLVKRLNEALYEIKYAPEFFYFRKGVSEKGDYAPFDIEMMYSPSRSTPPVSILKIEIECGRKQIGWDNKFPTQRMWPRGVSCLLRKNYKGSDFFIKVSRTYESAFCFDSKWFIKQINEGRIHIETWGTEKFGLINWDLAYNDKNFLVVEDDKYNILLEILLTNAFNKIDMEGAKNVRKRFN